KDEPSFRGGGIRAARLPLFSPDRVWNPVRAGGTVSGTVIPRECEFAICARTIVPQIAICRIGIHRK
ncbi:MAG: hypothetical protein M1445_08975, partial [Bacteroidetes bacterium]|nr:hypothetical protein [Bacteroidota bacterium]